MRFLLLAVSLALVTPTFARAESFFLFSLRKPVKPENLVQVYIPLGANCEPGRLDFAWGMNNGACIKAPNATLHCVTLSRLKEVRANPNHKAACPAELPPGGKCYTKFITAEELGYVGKNPNDFPVVIRSEKSASTGKCRAAAYIYTGDKVVQLSGIDVNAIVHSQSMQSAVVTIKGIDFRGPDGKVASSWPAPNSSQRTISADMGSCGISFGRAQQAPWPNFGRPQCN